MRSENSKLQITAKHEKWMSVARSVPRMGVEGCIRAIRWHSSNSECGSPANSECGSRNSECRLRKGSESRGGRVKILGSPGTADLRCSENTWHTWHTRASGWASEVGMRKSEVGMKKGDRLKPGLQRGCGGRKAT